jgi:GTP-binding protein
MSLYPQARFLTSAAEPGQLMADDGREIAFTGRSNAGKSSAINALVGRKGFARVSRTPGRTQLINFFELAPGHRLVDLPGYGFARVHESVRERWSRLLRHYFDVRASLAGLVLIVDSRRGLGEHDLAMLDWMGSRERPSHVLLTKADKLARSEALRAERTARAVLGARAVSVQLFSAPARVGLEEARAVMQRWLQDESAAG